MVKRLFYRHCLKIRSDSSSQLYLPRRESGAHSFPAFCTLSIPSSGPGDCDASPSHETMMLVLHMDQDTMMLLLSSLQNPTVELQSHLCSNPASAFGRLHFSGPRSKSIKDPAHTQCRIDQPGARNTVSGKMHLYQGHA